MCTKETNLALDNKELWELMQNELQIRFLITKRELQRRFFTSALFLISKPVRFVRDIVRASLIPNKPRYFMIEFKDKTYKYEASQAEEIIAKITYLIGLQKYRSIDLDAPT